MSYDGPKESYHTIEEIDLSSTPLAIREAINNTTDETGYYLESSKATTKKSSSPWFECPVTGEWLPKTEGIRISGTYYSQEAAADILEDKRRARL